MHRFIIWSYARRITVPMSVIALGQFILSLSGACYKNQLICIMFLTFNRFQADGSWRQWGIEYLLWTGHKIGSVGGFFNLLWDALRHASDFEGLILQQSACVRHDYNWRNLSRVEAPSRTFNLDGNNILSRCWLFFGSFGCPRNGFRECLCQTMYDNLTGGF